MNNNAQLRRYTWNAPETGLDTPLAVYDVATATSYFYRTDANRNVIALTNASGLKAWYEYSPFGVTLTATGAAAELNPFRFSSEYADSETGLVYYNYRYYNPELGRWLSRDPIAESGGLNLYNFVANNPVNQWDVLGMSEIMSAQEFVGSTFDFKRNLLESFYKIRQPFIGAYNALFGEPPPAMPPRVPDVDKYRNCIAKCLNAIWPLAAIGGGLTTLGAELIPKGHGAGAFGGSKGTSIISWSLSKSKWTNIKLPIRIPTYSFSLGLKGATRRVPSILGRWSSVIGPMLIFADLGKYNKCLNNCMEDPCR